MLAEDAIKSAVSESLSLSFPLSFAGRIATRVPGAGDELELPESRF